MRSSTIVTEPGLVLLVTLHRPTRVFEFSSMLVKGFLSAYYSRLMFCLCLRWPDDDGEVVKYSQSSAPLKTRLYLAQGPTNRVLNNPE